MTEKLYRALDAGVVPIVYGGADYSQYAPPQSYINVADFKSPRDLADYLRFLDSNEAMYLKYFEWKKDWDVINRPRNGWCDLCEKINNVYLADDQKTESKSYENISKWWYDEVACYPGSSYLNITKTTMKN